MSVEYCSLTGARTFLDTNLVHLEVLNSSEIVSLFVGREPTGVAPDLLPDIVHESVHHWCFNTPVGVALTLSRSELMERSLTDRAPGRIVNLLARQRLMFESLRPVIEGLACYAEFDAFPGAGNHRATPLEWLGPIARPGQRVGSGPGDADELIMAILTQMRALESTARRKDTLLAQPLEPTSRGGYLTGYTMVKGWQAGLLNHSALALDAELVMCFLRAYIFSDYALARRILEPADTTMSPSEFTIVDHVAARLDRLSDARAAARLLEAYNEAFRPSIDDEPSLRMAETVRSLEAEPADYDAWDRLQTSSLARLQEPDDEPAVEVARRAAVLTLANRDWLCLASQPGVLRSRSDGFVQFREKGSDLPRLSVPPHAEPADGSIGAGLVRGDFDVDAALECWIGPIEEGAVYVLASELGVHVHVELWSADEDLIAEFIASVRSNRFMMELSEQLRTVHDDLLRLQPWYGEFCRLIDEAVDVELARQASTAVELFQGGDEAKEALWEDGFYGVFEDLTLLRAVVALGLAASTDDRILGDRISGDADPATRMRVIDAAWMAGMAKGLDLTSPDGARLLI